MAMTPQDEPAEQARTWLTRLASGDMDAQELARFKDWRSQSADNDRAFESQRAIWRAIGSAGASTSFPPPAPSRPLGQRRARHRLGWRADIPRKVLPRAAGVAAALLAIAYVMPDAMVRMNASHTTSVAVKSVTLPDGSAAVLDAGSAIAVSFDEGGRNVSILRGRAWFNVAHGDRRPFRVEALDGVTQDVGTAFEVSRATDAVSVGVTDGRVIVTPPRSSTGLAMRAAQRLRYTRDGRIERLPEAVPADIAPWRNGELLLSRASVTDAIETISPYRHGPVFVLGATSLTPRVSAVFRTDRTDEAIDAIAQTTGMSVHRFMGVTVLKAAGK
jgi:transmembrane sensor